jgi:hypothetical protein
MYTGEMLLFLLVAGHFLADYPLQGQFLAEAKSRHTKLGGVYWLHALTGHSFIHGGVVAILTGSVILGIAETVVHWITDWLKCENKISLHQDQAIHLLSKVVWFLFLPFL